MALIDPSPDASELQALGDCLRSFSDAIQAYLQTGAGQADVHFGVLTNAALNLNAYIQNIATSRLDLSLSGGGQAVDVLNAATAQLTQAIAVRNSITKDLTIVQTVVALGAAVYTGNIGGIISSGSSLLSML